MFELPCTPESLLVAIPTFVVAEDLFTFLATIEDEVDRVERIPLLHSGETINIPSAIHQASLVDKITLQNLADRFDCEAMGACLRDSLQFYYDSLTGIKLLAAASKVESITVARVAIIKMGKDRKWENKASYHRCGRNLNTYVPAGRLRSQKWFGNFKTNSSTPIKSQGDIRTVEDFPEPEKPLWCKRGCHQKRSQRHSIPQR